MDVDQLGKAAGPTTECQNWKMVISLRSSMLTHASSVTRKEPDRGTPLPGHSINWQLPGLDVSPVRLDCSLPYYV